MSITVWLDIQVIVHLKGQKSKVTPRYWAMNTEKDTATDPREGHMSKWLINASIEWMKYIKYINSILEH